MKQSRNPPTAPTPSQGPGGVVPALPPGHGATPRRNHFVDLTPLRLSPPFFRLWLGSGISGIGSQMTIMAVGLHVYHLTQSTFAVAMVGTVSLVPMVLAGLYGGMLADAFDRRKVALVAAIVAWASTAGIAAVAWVQIDTVWPLYVLTSLNAVAATIIGTSRAAIQPRLLPRELLPAAAALSGISVGLMVTVGPALAGILVASVGFGWTYTVDVVLFSAAFLGILSLPPIVPEGERHSPGLASIRTGIDFLKRAPNIRMSFIVDIVAMSFGRPHALFPAVGAVLIGGGAVTVGILTAAGAIGTLLSSLLSGRLGGVRRQGVAIGWAISVYGVFVLGFGVVLGATSLGWFPQTGFGAPAAGDGAATSGSGLMGTGLGDAHLLALGLAALMLVGTGAADNVSSVFRSTMLQTAVPDNMRGRLQGIFTVVVTGGPRVGDFYVGVVATLGVLWLPPLLGGLMIIALIGLLMRFQSSFRHYDAMDPQP